MTPEQFEHYVAYLLSAKGYETRVSPLSNDWGIDVIAIKGDLFNGNDKPGRFLGKERPFVLTDGESNLYAPTRKEAVAYFKEYTRLPKPAPGLHQS